MNNAGILRDKAFNNMTLEDFEFALQVHFMGTVYCTKAAWPIMRKQQYGRIVVTTSGSGTVGNFGQSNYGAAKMAVNGLINVLRLEGAKYNILCNAISPSAHTRMTEGLLPPHMLKFMRPELVSPAVAWLCSEECNANGEIIAATAGNYARVQYFQSEGVQFDPDEPVTIEMVAEKIGKIRDLSKAKPYTGLMGTVESEPAQDGEDRLIRDGWAPCRRLRNPLPCENRQGALAKRKQSHRKPSGHDPRSGGECQWIVLNSKQHCGAMASASSTPA